MTPRSGDDRLWLDDAGCWHVDVRGLPPPQPLVTILRLLEREAGERAGHERTVIVHHEREPQLLYPALAERGWQAQHIAGDPGEVRLRLDPLR